MAVTSDISICNAALQMIGADGITSLTLDETRENRICNSIYFTIKQDVLQSSNWRFSIRQEKLNRLVSNPLFGFKYAYSLPADFLRLIGKDNPNIKHQIFENKVYTDLESVQANIQYDVNARYFPAYFVRLLELELAAVLSISLLEDENKADIFAKFARTQKIKATNIDSRNNTANYIPESKYSLTQIRH